MNIGPGGEVMETSKKRALHLGSAVQNVLNVLHKGRRHACRSLPPPAQLRQPPQHVVLGITIATGSWAPP